MIGSHQLERHTPVYLHWRFWHSSSLASFATQIGRAWHTRWRSALRTLMRCYSPRLPPCFKRLLFPRQSATWLPLAPFLYHTPSSRDQRLGSMSLLESGFQSERACRVVSAG